MTRALESSASCATLKANPKLTATIGGYSYRIERVGAESIYAVTDGKETIRVPLQWAFGQGAAGQTYLFERDGRWYESRVSYHSAIHGLDLTMGAQYIPARNLDEAAGRLTAPTEAGQCFDCHATHAVAKREPTLPSMVEGVQCERCHGDADRHPAAITSGDAVNGAMRKLRAIVRKKFPISAANVTGHGPGLRQPVRWGYRTCAFSRIVSKAAAATTRKIPLPAQDEIGQYNMMIFLSLPGPTAKNVLPALQNTKITHPVLPTSTAWAIRQDSLPC
jgi:hypothetical protein